MLLLAGVAVGFFRFRLGRVCPLRIGCWNHVAGYNQYFITEMSQRRNSDVCFFALAGDLGAAVSPTMVGKFSEMSGGNLKVGLLIATVFPIILFFGLIVLNKVKKR